MVREGGATSLSQHFQRLTVQNEQLRADVVQLRLRAVAGSRRPAGSGSAVHAKQGIATSCGAFSSVGSWRAHESAVPDICVAGQVAMACSWDGRLTTFDLGSGWCEGPSILVGAESSASSKVASEQDGAAMGGVAPLQAVAACKCEHQLLTLTGSEDSRAWIWNAGSEALQLLAGHEGPINDVAFHPKQGSPVACTASDDCKALLWDATIGKQVRSLSQHLKGVTSCALLGARGPPGGIAGAFEYNLVTGSADGHVRLWDLRAPSLLYTLPAATSRRLSIDANPASQLLLAASDLGTISAWDLRTLARLQHVDLAARAQVHGELTSIALSPCCSHLAVGTLDGELVCMDLRSPASDLPREEDRIECRPVHQDAIYGLAWGSQWPWRDDSSPFLLTASHDGTWSCWVLGGGEARDGGGGHGSATNGTATNGSTAKQWLGNAAGGHVS